MRLEQGGSRIDRSRTVHFTFDGRQYEGFAGDTIASALLANNVRIVGHGIYTGRPRGVFTAGPEEPNAIVQVRWPNGTSEPSLRATVVEIADGMEARSLRGRGRLDGEDRRRFDKKYVHVETLVIGGGSAGRAAASNADGRVLLVDDGPVVEPIDGVDVLARATALGIYDQGYVLVAERRPGHRTEGRLWHIRARRIVLATGQAGGTYEAVGREYQRRLGREGLRVELRSSAGSIENLQRLLGGQADVAFVQGGTYPLVSDPEGRLRGMAALYREPLWIFYRGQPLTDGLASLAGRRVAIGAPKV